MRFIIVERATNYILQVDKEENVLIVHVTNPAAIRALRGNCFYSYNGERFINTAGGKSKDIDLLNKYLKFSREALDFIMEFRRLKQAKII